MKLAAAFDPGGFPACLIERYRTADGPALKVALYLLLGNKCLPEQIAAELSLPLPTVERSLDFWVRAGLLTGESGEEDVPGKTEAAKDVASPQKIVLAERRISAIKMAQCLRNPEVAALFQESQAFLGRTLTQNESERLLCIYEFDEFPVDVILIIVAHSKKRAKRSLISYIERVAAEWKEDGIDTSEKAEEYLRLLSERERHYKRIADTLETDVERFTYRDRQYIDRWFEEYGYDGAFAAEAAQRQNNRSVPYLNKILKSWFDKGYRSVKETRAEVANTAAPVPERRKSGKKDDLFLRAVKETNAGG